ncbi:MAG: sodium:solute symporter, partial [Bacteroidetes bacterium]|nr:sodium:solute symporter [Bacteroidota bacterium]
LYAFGLFTKIKVQDDMVPWVCVASPILSYLIQLGSPMLGYKFGFEILILNGALTMLGLWLFRERE